VRICALLLTCTAATFDEQTDEFVVHTPNLGATKWWIGGAAQTATHCSVFAQLVIRGKKHGTKTFIVPLRDPMTFALLPGVNIGDIGKKMGRDGIDNGYIQCVPLACIATFLAEQPLAGSQTCASRARTCS